MGSASGMIREAKSHLGLGEPNGIQRFVGRKVGIGGNYPWCEAFTSYCAYRSGNFSAVCYNVWYVYTVTHAQKFSSRGRWRPGTGGNVRRAHTGDLVWFDWGGSNRTGGIDHVGVVEKRLSGGRVQTIEGNGLPYNTPILTPRGWKPIGELSVDDAVIDPQGMPSKVTGVYPQGVRPCYRLTLSDGRTIIADKNHRWSVRFNRNITVKTTAELFANTGGHAQIVRIDVSPDFEETDSLPLHPWVVGALLGDGCMTGGDAAFCNGDDYIVERFEALTGVTPKNHGGNTWYLAGLRPIVKELDCQNPLASSSGTNGHRWHV